MIDAHPYAGNLSPDYSIKPTPKILLLFLEFVRGQQGEDDVNMRKTGSM